jgi:hypothetical protein
MKNKNATQSEQISKFQSKNDNYIIPAVDDLIWFITCLTPLSAIFQQYFSYIMATSFSGGRNRREPPTMDKQLVNFITCGCESSAPFCNLQSREPIHAVLVIGLYELLGNKTT